MSASLERFSSGALLTGLQSGCSAVTTTPGPAHRVLFLGFHLSRRRCHHRDAGLRDHVGLGHLCWLWSCRSSRPNGVIEGVGFAAIVQWSALVRRVLHGDGRLLSFALTWRSALSAFP